MKDTQKTFLYNEMNIAEEDHKNNKIKDYIKNNSFMNIIVLKKGIIKIKFYEKVNYYLMNIYLVKIK